MAQPLALALRPKRLSEMIGGEKLASKIKTRIAKGRDPQAWMFSGQTGSGKTTLTRIIAVSYQCRHSEFGEPCDRCVRHYKQFDITELNMPDIGVKELRDILDGVFLNPMPGSRAKVYALDEAHTMSKAAQNLMLKFTEDCPKTTKFILATTEPQRIIRTLRRRCTARYVVPVYELKDIRKLVKKGLRKLKCDFDSGELVERLMERNITSPGLILNAVESYASGSSATEAANVEFGIDVKALTRAIYTGSWEEAAKCLMSASQEDVPQIRGSIASYLNTILLGESDFTSKARNVSDAILSLSGNSDDLPTTTAALFKICKYFHRGHK